jgi:transcriptional regulator with GAF, ATPase, and Fis domain
LRWLIARARGEQGDVDGAVTELDALLTEVRRAANRELEWQVLTTAGRLNAMRGADFVARRQEQEAMEVLESIATRLPRDHREAFWHDPRRREVRRRAGAEDVGTGRLSSRASMSETTFHQVGLEARAARLLELIKRLASEHDLDRLLERITDSAVELAGAERGFVLLVGEGGGLSARTARGREGASDPHVAFSQSIAEAVLIDGEPIITVDARDDNRLSEYMSVHKLMLKSVACLPIRGRSGTIGVLYLEHRMRRGRFDEADVDLLFAFADQAAIALENARLIAENERRRRELEATNAELSRAKAEIERVLVARTAELEDAKREVDRARQELRGNYERHGIVGGSEPMRRVFTVIDRVRDASVSIVIHGESGTGKELVARAIHYGGPRAEAPFVAVNCAAIPEALLESELFGHVRGAFTGADRDRRGVISQANEGTLFLDEVGDMPAKMQVDLLRVLQERKVRPVGGDRDEIVDVRIICASNKQLTDLVERGDFREDLFYRLNVVELKLPPLRDRPEDIPLLVDHFLAQFAERDGVSPKRLTREALRRLAEHPMPGNVRQLEHVLLNAWVLVEGDVIDADDLALDDGFVVTERIAARERGQVAVDAASEAKATPQSYGDFKADEKQRILEALESHNWNRVRAAKELGIPRRTFYRRLKEYDII